MSQHECVVCYEKLTLDKSDSEDSDSEDDVDDEPNPNDPVIISLCGHVFHRGCLAQWFRKKARDSACPMCRKPSRPRHVLPLDFKGQVAAAERKLKKTGRTELEPQCPPMMAYAQNRAKLEKLEKLFLQRQKFLRELTGAKPSPILKLAPKKDLQGSPPPPKPRPKCVIM